MHPDARGYIRTKSTGQIWTYPVGSGNTTLNPEKPAGVFKFSEWEDLISGRNQQYGEHYSKVVRDGCEFVPLGKTLPGVKPDVLYDMFAGSAPARKRAYQKLADELAKPSKLFKALAKCPDQYSVAEHAKKIATIDIVTIPAPTIWIDEYYEPKLGRRDRRLLLRR